jgi:TonB family protein
MALREKFGRLVLLEQTDSDPLGDEYRAARLGAAGFDRLVSVLRFSPAVSAHAEASKRLVDEARTASQVHNPSLVRVLGVGRVNQSFYVSTELPEGRTVRAVLSRCAEEGFPFAVDHALMIATRAATGLEYLHSRKDENGRALMHGLLTPGRLVVAFDGEVKVKGLGLWPALGATDLLKPEERAYLAPEQAAGQAEPRSDVYALGLVLLEALLGQPPDGSDPLLHVTAARIASPGGDPVPLPKPLSALLRRSLGREPAARFASIAEMRKAIDAMLFSGDFTPTTFDLAFFMHTLFRDEVEGEARAIEEASKADYREFLTDEAPKPAPPPSPRTEPFDGRSPAPDATDALSSMPTAVPLPTLPEAPHSHDSAASPPRAPALDPDSAGAPLARAVREAGGRDASGRDNQQAAQAARPAGGLSRNAWLAIGIAGAILLAGGSGGLYFVAQRRAASAAAASAEQAAAQARVRELETRIAQLEREKADAEAKAAEDARKALEQQAAAGGKSADPAAIARAQEEARQRARAEQERKQQEELARLADAKREEQRVAAARAALATPPPTPLPLPTPVQAARAPPVVDPAAQQAAPNPSPTVESIQLPLSAAASPSPQAAGGQASSAAGLASAGGRQFADPSDPAVRPPGLISEELVPYPPRAIPRRIATTVVVRALVDETGKVAEAAVIQSSGQPPDYGFDQAALNRVKGRKYRPARRNNVPVPIWVVVRVEFRPPPVR